MSRLIDADKLKAHFAWWNDENKEIFNSIIDQQPTAETVKYGRWEDCSNGWMCSVCKHDARKDYPCCPYCGAKMNEWGDAE